MKRAQQSTGWKNVTGRRILEARLCHTPALSQEELSAKLAAKGIHLSQEALSRIENGDRGVLDFELIAIARCLKGNGRLALPADPPEPVKGARGLVLGLAG